MGRRDCALSQLQVLTLSHFSFSKIKLLGSFFFFFETLLCFATIISAMHSMDHSDITSSDDWFYLQLLKKLNPIITKPQSVLVTTSVALIGTAVPCQVSTNATTGASSPEEPPSTLTSKDLTERSLPVLQSQAMPKCLALPCQPAEVSGIWSAPSTHAVSLTTLIGRVFFISIRLRMCVGDKNGPVVFRCDGAVGFFLST